MPTATCSTAAKYDDSAPQMPSPRTHAVGLSPDPNLAGTRARRAAAQVRDRPLPSAMVSAVGPRHQPWALTTNHGPSPPAMGPYHHPRTLTTSHGPLPPPMDPHHQPWDLPPPTDPHQQPWTLATNHHPAQMHRRQLSRAQVDGRRHDGHDRSVGGRCPRAASGARPRAPLLLLGRPEHRSSCWGIQDLPRHLYSEGLLSSLRVLHRSHQRRAWIVCGRRHGQGRPLRQQPSRSGTQALPRCPRSRTALSCAALAPAATVHAAIAQVRREERYHHLGERVDRGLLHTHLCPSQVSTQSQTRLERPTTPTAHRDLGSGHGTFGGQALRKNDLGVEGFGIHKTLTPYGSCHIPMTGIRIVARSADARPSERPIAGFPSVP
jgi:hypothetical protein